MCRYALGSWVQDRVTGAFPAGTLTVNALGCLLIGIAGVLLLGSPAAGQSRDAWRLVAVVGFLGGFTTYSAFSWETLELVDARRYGMAMLYVLLTNALCLGCVAIGYRIGQRLLPQ